MANIGLGEKRIERGVVLPRKEWVHETSASSFLLLLLVADLAFVVLHFLWQTTPLVNNALYSLERDKGHPEFYQYVKELWIIVLLLSLRIRTRAAGYLAWAVLFAYLLLDDALEVHEELGGYIATSLSFVPLFGLRAQDFGELAITATAGALFLPPLVWCYVRGSDTFKQSTRHLLLLLLMVAFFGVFVDMLHAAIWMGPEVNLLLGVVEDGGEMIAMSFVAWYVFLLNVRGGHPGFSLRRLLGDFRLR